MNIIRLRFAAFAAAFVFIAAAAGCAASDPESEAVAGTTAIAIGVGPTITNTSAYYANEQDYFGAEGLSVEFTVNQSGAEAIPLLLNGQVQFAQADPVSVLVAISKGTPLVIVANAAIIADSSDEDSYGTIVPADSDITSVKDTAGHTIAVNALNSLAQIGTKAAIDAGGGDSDAVQWVEVPLPQTVEAVSRGTVDGSATAEPFLTPAKDAGLRVLPDSGLAVELGGIPTAVYITTAEYLAQHEDVVKGFAAAMDTANQALGKDPELVRKTAETSTTLTPEQLATIILPPFGAKPSVDQLERLETQLVRYGVLSEPLDDLAKKVFTG